VIALATLATLPAQSQSHKPAYRFESEPRAVLSEVAPVARDPKIAIRPNGAIYMLAVCGGHNDSQLGFFVSNDGGDSFGPPVMISEKGATVNSHGENSPNFAFGSIEIYALWEQKLPEGGSDLMFARSLRFGHSFEKPIRVTDKTSPSTNAFSHLAVAPNGDIYAVWLDGRDPKAGPKGTFSIYMARSTDRGASFGKNIQVAVGACPCCRPVMAIGEKGEVHIAWRHVFEGNLRDMVVATSMDRGETFSAPVRVAEDGWKIYGCPDSGASLARSGNRLFITWYSEGDGSNAGIRISWSDDGGKSFSRPVIVSGKIVDANHPSISVSSDGSIVAAFEGRDPQEKDGWGPARPYVVAITNSGSVSGPTPVLGTQKSGGYPVILAGTVGRVYVAWTEAGEKGRQVVFSRGRKTSP